ncbi:MAG: amidohydrolase family protein [Rhodoferax sp.]
MKKIVLEEHFITPSLAGYSADVELFIDPAHFNHYKSRLVDFDNQRLEEMDKNGIDISVLSVTTPGVQLEPDRAIAVRKAKEVNDLLATVIQRHPTRFSGFAHLALQDPREAANELERAVKELGLRGALINGHTNGEYLDDEKFWPVWERAEALNVPIYLHPANAPDSAKCLNGYPELLGPAWAWTAETATHALRMVMGGVFDRFPKVTLVLGHMGETLPFVLWRLDSRYQMMKHSRTLQKMPSQYIRDNIMITTSGSCDVPALLCSMLALGADRIMFSVDYPYESTQEAVNFIDRAPISDTDRAKICHLNAERLLGL